MFISLGVLVVVWLARRWEGLICAEPTYLALASQSIWYWFKIECLKLVIGGSEMKVRKGGYSIPCFIFLLARSEVNMNPVNKIQGKVAIVFSDNCRKLVKGKSLMLSL